MKLSEALILRADIQKRTEQLKQRIVRNAKVQEGDVPVEKVDDLLVELENHLKELANLIKRINKTNLLTELHNGRTLADGLVDRDNILIKIGILNSLVNEASIKQDRYSKTEVKFISYEELY